MPLLSGMRGNRGDRVRRSVDLPASIHIGDIIVVKAAVNYAGRTSMEVGVRVETERMKAAKSSMSALPT